MYKDKDGIIRFEKTKDKKEFKKQLDDFEKAAQAGETICLTDLLANRENVLLGDDDEDN